jgi:hypothetical protein
MFKAVSTKEERDKSDIIRKNSLEFKGSKLVRASEREAQDKFIQEQVDKRQLHTAELR